MSPDRPFTGRHMLAIMLGFFGVVIAVNVTMAVMANRSWTGFVVENSYVAGQHFNENTAEARAQAALGWKGRLEIEGGAVRYVLGDAQGTPVKLAGATASFRRPSYASEDVTVPLVPIVGGHGVAADFVPRDGLWILEIEADAGLERPYRDTRRILVEDGRVAGGRKQ